MASLKLPSQDRIRQLLDYDPDTGFFTWKIFRRWSAPVGGKAGHLNSKGYMKITIDSIEYQAHRIAWKYMTGEDPIYQIDHIDGVKLNNRFSNLRQATNEENQKNIGKQKNNTSGQKGVTYTKKKKKWMARIGVKYKRIFIGEFEKFEDAVSAYKVAAKKYHGDYARDVHND